MQSTQRANLSSGQVPLEITSPSTLFEKGEATVAVDRKGGPITIYYELHGQRDAKHKVLFIMGLNGNCYLWSNQVDFLCSLPDYQVCIFDNRGVGLSSVPEGFYSTSEMAKDTFELMQHLKWTSGIHLVGLSMGGMISQELLLLAPKGTFKTAIFAATNAGRVLSPLKTSYEMIRMLLKSPEERIEMVMPLLFPEDWLSASNNNKKYPNCPTNRDYTRRRLVEQIARSRVQTPQGARAQMMAVMTHHVSAKRLNEIRDMKIPILVITGNRDQIIKHENSIYLAKELDATLVVLAGIGHGLTSQSEETFNYHLHSHISNR